MAIEATGRLPRPRHCLAHGFVSFDVAVQPVHSRSWRVDDDEWMNELEGRRRRRLQTGHLHPHWPLLTFISAVACPLPPLYPVQRWFPPIHVPLSRGQVPSTCASCTHLLHVKTLDHNSNTQYSHLPMDVPPLFG